MRRPLEELAPSTVQTYRSRARKLWLKVQAGEATPTDRLELAEMEGVLGVRGSDIPPPGDPESGHPDETTCNRTIHALHQRVCPRIHQPVGWASDSSMGKSDARQRVRERRLAIREARGLHRGSRTGSERPIRRRAWTRAASERDRGLEKAGCEEGVPGVTGRMQRQTAKHRPEKRGNFVLCPREQESVSRQRVRSRRWSRTDTVRVAPQNCLRTIRPST